jgi:hypothetical protein
MNDGKPSTQPSTQPGVRPGANAPVARLLGQALGWLDKDPSRPPSFFGTQSCALVGQGIKLAALDFDHNLFRPVVESALSFAERGLREEAARGAGGEAQGDPVMRNLRNAIGRAQCWHAHAVGKALLANSAIELPYLEQAHAEYLRALQIAAPAMGKEYYLPALQGGAELCLGAGRTNMAEQLLQVERPFQPCANRQALLTDLIAVVRKHREKPGTRTGSFMLDNMLGKLGGGTKTPPADTGVIPEGDPVRLVFEAVFFLWRTERGHNWLEYKHTLDQVRPEPHPTLSTAALALIEDRFLLGNATPDWRRVSRRLAL